jgi:hypothetical protein
VPSGGGLFDVGVRFNVMLSSCSWFASRTCFLTDTGFPLPKRAKISALASAAEACRQAEVVKRRRAT